MLWGRRKCMEDGHGTELGSAIQMDLQWNYKEWDGENSKHKNNENKK